MIVALMRTHDSSMKIHDRRHHILSTMEGFTKSVIFYAFHQTLIRRVRRNEFCFHENFKQKYGKPSNNKIYETFKKCFDLNYMN